MAEERKEKIMIIKDKDFLCDVKNIIEKIESEKVSFSLKLMESIFVYIRDKKHLTESMVAYLAQYFVSSEDMNNSIYKFLEENFNIMIVEHLCKDLRVVAVERKEVCDA